MNLIEFLSLVLLAENMVAAGDIYSGRCIKGLAGWWLLT